MGGSSCFHVDGMMLLKQLEVILERDTLINEIGFVHPSQLATLDRSPDATHYDETAFWNKDHKLAISTEILPHLYRAVMHEYMNVKKRLEGLIKQSIGKYSLESPTFGSDLDHLLESEILKHTMALLILNSDFGSAWNSRKMVIVRKGQLSLLMDELRLCTLILSYSPKSQCTWSHRRWVIEIIGEKFQIMHEIVGQDSELVKQIAEKSKMNYRAWSHLCWLIPYMKRTQVIDELNKSKKWSELHTADNCCFHFRRRLLFKMLEDISAWEDDESCINQKTEIYFLWKEELGWNESLISRYIGREALWLHRRFLSQCYINYFTIDQETRNSNGEDFHGGHSTLDDFLDKELELLLHSLDVTDNEFEDTQVQAQHATAYIIWISKQVPPHTHEKLQSRLQEMDLKPIMIKLCADKPHLCVSPLLQ